MIRAHRVAATAQDDAGLISGWNIAPNVSYSIAMTPGTTSCGVFLFAESGALVASGAGLVGAEQPCVLIPQSGQSIGMIDAELGWHLLLTTVGTEAQRTIRINPAVDLPDEIHPIYGDDALALVRATAGIDGAAHYIDDLTVTCPLGLGAGLGDVASVPVDGVAVVGQVESITWTGTPNGAQEQSVIRRHVAIAPEPYVAPVPVVPPVVADDTGETVADEPTSGNVLTNDEPGLTIVAVNGLSANVGVAVAGSNGGLFVISSTGAWTFDPDGDFAVLTGSETAETSVTYHASDGVSESMATLTITVSSGGVATDPYWADTGLCINASGADGSTTITDEKGNAITRNGDTQIDTSLGYPAIEFDGSGDYLSIADAAALRLGTGDFTMEVFLYSQTFADIGGANRCPLAKGAGASGGWSWLFTTGGLIVWYDTVGRFTTTVAIPLNTLTHACVTRESGVFRAFVGGVAAGGVTASIDLNSTAPLLVGTSLTSTGWFWGKIPSVRITKGVARWTAAFTPPEFPYPIA